MPSPRCDWNQSPMPTAPAKPCLHPGCPALVINGNRCSAHAKHSPGATYDQTTRKLDPVLARNAELRGSNWQKVARLHKQQNPLCSDPFADHAGWPVAVQQSHHVLPLSTHPHLAFDLENLAPLCSRCHAKVEAMERQGKPTQHLFTPPRGEQKATGHALRPQGPFEAKRTQFPQTSSVNDL